MIKLFKAVVLGLSLLLANGCDPYVQDFEKGLAAYDAKDYAAALKEWRPLAAQGNASAQYYLGVMYDFGRGVKQDYKEAARLYGLAAAQGHEEAQDGLYTLGMWYEHGHDVETDYKEAARLYGLAAAHGNADAQHNLGTMYHHGVGVTTDYKEAERLYGLAAAQGHEEAQGGLVSLGTMYQDGQGVTQDYKEAARLYGLAAAQGYTAAQFMLGTMYQDGHGVIQNNVYAHMWFYLAALTWVEQHHYFDAVRLRDSIAQRMTAADISKAQDLAKECHSKQFKGC